MVKHHIYLYCTHTHTQPPPPTTNNNNTHTHTFQENGKLMILHVMFNIGKLVPGHQQPSCCLNCNQYHMNHIAVLMVNYGISNTIVLEIP